MHLELWDSGGMTGLMMTIDGYQYQSAFDETRTCIYLGSAVDRTASITISHKLAGAAIGKWSFIASGSGSL